MPRMARVVVPGIPHHVTQRGARRMQVFFAPADYELYLELLREQARRCQVDIWAYCLMPNHVHFIAAPQKFTSLASAFGEAHRKYAMRINKQHGWKGHLWQERFASFPMDELHLLAAVRYVLLNPVRAGLVSTSADWPYCSLPLHRGWAEDALVTPGPLAERIDDWNLLLETSEPALVVEKLRKHSSTGRPLGDDAFISRVEKCSAKEPSSKLC